MDKRQISHERGYITTSVVLTATSFLILVLATWFSANSYLSSKESTDKLGISSATNDFSLSSSADALIALSSFDSSADLSQVRLQINQAGNRLKALSSTYYESTNQIISSLRRGTDNLGNALFLAAASTLFVLIALVLQSITGRSFGRLSEELISQIEKYRQLLAVKRALEVELEETKASAHLLKTQLEKAGIKISTANNR